MSEPRGPRRYANRDVSVCETYAPLGNLRQEGFFEIWDSEAPLSGRFDFEAVRC